MRNWNASPPASERIPPSSAFGFPFTPQPGWNEAAILAQALSDMVPTEAEFWLKWAYATRRKDGGSIAEARNILEKAGRLFPNESTIFFNLACYDSLLGNLEAAKTWLDRALETGDRKTIQTMILEDPDLESLRKEYGLEARRRE